MDASFYIRISDASPKKRASQKRIDTIQNAIMLEFSHFSTGWRVVEVSKLSRQSTSRIYHGALRGVPVTTIEIFAEDKKARKRIYDAVTRALPHTLCTFARGGTMVLHCPGKKIRKRTLLI